MCQTVVMRSNKDTRIFAATIREEKLNFFRPLKLYLNFAKHWGAFPLAYRDDEDEEFCFNKWSYLRAGVLILLSLAIYFSKKLILYYLDDSENWFRIQEAVLQGLTPTDSVAMVCLWIPHTIAFFIYFMLLKSSGKVLSELARRFTSLEHVPLSDGDILRQFRWTSRKGSAIICLGFVACILSGYIEALASKSQLGNSKACFAAMMALRSMLTAIILLSPMSTVTYMIMDHTLSSLSLVMSRYVDSLDRLVKSGAENGECESTNKSILHWNTNFVQAGFVMTELSDLTEEALGPFILLTFSVAFATQVFGAFFGSLLFTSVLEENVNWVVFMFGLCFTILGLLALFSIVTISLKGQAITDAAKRARKFTESCFFEQATSELSGDTTSKKMAVLIQRWSRSAVIRPMDAFDLGRSTTISLYGLLLTYIIVLLQFKFS